MSIPKEALCYILNEPPLKNVNFSEEDPQATFKLVTRPLGGLQNGEVLVKTIYLSNDPTQRAWIQKGIRADRMYVDPVRKGDVMRSGGLGQVIESRNHKYKVGDIVNTTLKWADYSIVAESAIFNKVEDTKVPLPLYLDVLGITGLTAYFGLKEVAKLKKSDVIIISAASGATGSMCVQIAKKIIGCKKVIGISGSREKCDFVKQLGADYCVDYHSKTFVQDLAVALGDDKFCDVAFDGVGGSILDAMLMFTKPFGRVVACGAIASYNDFSKSKVLNWSQIIVNRLDVKGFIVFDFREKYSEGIRDLMQWIRDGKIKYDTSTYTVVDLSHNATEFKKIPSTWGILFKEEKAPGKLLTKVAQPKL